MTAARLGIDPVATGITVGDELARALDSTKRFELTCEYGPDDEITRVVDINIDPPPHLDGDGVARIGTAVSPGMMLVGRLVEDRSPKPRAPAEAALDAALGVEPLRDASLRCPAGVAGTVVAVRSTPPTKKARGEIAISIDAPRPLAVGDVLELDGTARGVVAQIGLVIGGDLAWPGETGTRDVRKVESAIDALAARCIGPYSLVTRQPIAGNARTTGQRVTGVDLRALRDRGASWIAHELHTAKSDDVDARSALYESIVRSAPACVAKDPFASRVLERELHALGFDLDIDAATVAIGLFDTDAIRERMPGVVAKPETLNYRTFRPERDGLFCEAIFGVGLERATRLGRVELAAPLLHPWALATVAELLDRSERELGRVLYGERTLAGADPTGWRDTGAHAIHDALAGLDLMALAAEPGPRGELARAFVAAGRHPRLLCFDAWPVLPPDLRPLVPLDGGRFATSDLNDLYRRLINRANRLRRLIELTAPDEILRNEARMLQRSLDSVVENGLRQPAVTGPEGRELKSLADLVQGADGRFARNLDGKRVDYSATGVVVPRGDVAGDRIRVPRAAARELFTPFVYARLERDGHVTTIKQARELVRTCDPLAEAALDEVVRERPLVVFPAETGAPRVASLEIELWDEPAFAVAPATIAALELGPVARIVVHVPVDPGAVDEARTNLRAPPRPAADAPGGWLARVARAIPIGPALFEAALAREADPVADATARTLLGRRLA